MEIVEIVLLVAGGIIFILSFLIPEKKGEATEQSRELVREEIADLVRNEMESVRGQVDGVVEEAVTYAMEKTERSLERLSNEKIMAVNEYSDTVLTEIHKNHEEAMFLYDMLNSKHDNLKDTVAAVNRTVKEVEDKLSRLPETTGIARLSQGRMMEEKPGGNGVVQPARLQEFHPVVFHETAPVPPGTASAPFGAAPVPAAPATSMPAASVPQTSMPQAAPKRAASMPAASMPAASMPQTSVPATSMPAASMPQTSMPATSVPATSMSATSMSQAGLSTDGRVSFLQERAVDGRNNNERILELYRQGKSKVAIARELGLGVGEVKLVIDLFRNQ